MAGGSMTSGLNPQTAQAGLQQAGLSPPMSGFPGQAPQLPGGSPLNRGAPGLQWPPPFAQGPPNASSYATPSYPQLFGGQWNQLSQQMAGPQYSPTPGMPGRPGPMGPGGGPMSNGQPIFNRGGGGWR